MKESLALPGGPATIDWRRNVNARRITLRIDPARGQVVVTLPARAARADGLALLTQNAGWVAEKLAALPHARPFADGAGITIDGLPHRILRMPGRGGAWLEGSTLHVSGEPEFLARRVTAFLRAEARRRFARQAHAKAGQAGLAISRVVVKDTYARWASCSPQGVLMFCWRLLMAPLHVQDYVVAHEVAHLRHLNHSPAFWALAEALSPHRAASDLWLEREGPGLLRVG